MNVRVRLAAPLAQLAGVPRLSVELPTGATVGDLCAQLAKDQPELAAGLPSVLVIVSGQNALTDDPLPPDQEVALLLPAAGGAH